MGTIAYRVRELRNRKGWSAAQLGKALSGQGVPWDRFTVKALENGKRKNVTLIEFLALAVVLDVAPVHLVFPLGEAAKGYGVTPNGLPLGVDAARGWFRGYTPYPGGDRHIYLSERPEDELQLKYPDEAGYEGAIRQLGTLMEGVEEEGRKRNEGGTDAGR